MNTKRQHPCTRFQNGEVKDFYTAMEVYAAQYREELLIARELYRDYAQGNTPEYLQKWRQELQEQGQAVEDVEVTSASAKIIYRQEVGEAIKREPNHIHIGTHAVQKQRQTERIIGAEEDPFPR